MQYNSKITSMVLVLGYIFLYLPILLTIILSFNVLGHFSTKWYGLLFHNQELLTALMASLKIATLSATLATILGTLAAVVLVRFGRFRGRTIFEIITTAPLIMPDVLTGLAILMMFVTLEQLINWPAHRGIITVMIAHTTIFMVYIYLVVQARLKDFNLILEEAASDLGARPTKVFFTITLPIIFPSLVAGWLLAFSFSLDDIVIASFLSGPGATTLPMLIFSSVRLGISPEINALAAIITAIVSLAVLTAGIIIHKKHS